MFYFVFIWFWRPSSDFCKICLPDWTATTLHGNKIPAWEETRKLSWDWIVFNSMWNAGIEECLDFASTAFYFSYFDYILHRIRHTRFCYNATCVSLKNHQAMQNCTVKQQGLWGRCLWGTTGKTSSVRHKKRYKKCSTVLDMLTC